MREVDQAIMPAIEATRALCPRPTQDQHLVIESDPFEEMNWADVFLFRLTLNMPELMVHRRSQLTDEQLSGFNNNRHLHWQQNHWR